MVTEYSSYKRFVRPTSSMVTEIGERPFFICAFVPNTEKLYEYMKRLPYVSACSFNRHDIDLPTDEGFEPFFKEASDCDEQDYATFCKSSTEYVPAVLGGWNIETADKLIDEIVNANPLLKEYDMCIAFFVPARQNIFYSDILRTIFKDSTPIRYGGNNNV